MDYISLLYRSMAPLINAAVDQNCRQDREDYAAVLAQLRSALGDDPEGLALDVADKADSIRDGTGQHAFAAGLRLGLALSGELEAYALPEI